MTNRDRYKALLKGWETIRGWDECLVSFPCFVAAVDAYEKALGDAEIERQYAYEQDRRVKEHVQNVINAFEAGMAQGRGK